MNSARSHRSGKSGNEKGGQNSIKMEYQKALEGLFGVKLNYDPESKKRKLQEIRQSASKIPKINNLKEQSILLIGNRIQKKVRSYFKTI